jgi:hypothetical protein
VFQKARPQSHLSSRLPANQTAAVDPQAGLHRAHGVALRLDIILLCRLDEVIEAMAEMEGNGGD